MHSDPFPITNANGKRRIVKIHLGISDKRIPNFVLNCAHHFPYSTTGNIRQYTNFPADSELHVQKQRNIRKLKLILNHIESHGKPLLL